MTWRRRRPAMRAVGLDGAVEPGKRQKVRRHSRLEPRRRVRRERQTRRRFNQRGGILRLAGLALLVGVVAASVGGAPAAGRTGPDQELLAARRLAAKHAPIVMLKRQTEACDGDGEPFAPAPVEVLLGDPAVALHDGGADRIVTRAPIAANLFQGGPDLYLDLPGNPRAPGCGFERHFKTRMDDHPPVAYARIAPGGTGERLALQYWLYYYFNDFNNTHESDWEMVQILFEAGSAAEALGQEPVAVALAQHGGGETARWEDPKLERDGPRPIIYPAAGSHATHYTSALFLGWGENGTGFGCDDSTGPSARVPLEARLIPVDSPTAESPFAWITYRGRWGEKQPWEYNGPTGPNTKYQWAAPFAWQDGLRQSSLQVPVAETLGPGPTRVFCGVVGFASSLLTSYQVHPWLVAITAASLAAGALALALVGRATLGAALTTYREHWRLFASLGIVLIPVGVLANGFQQLVVTYPPGRLIFEVMNESPAARLAAALTVGSVQQLAGLIIVGPAVIQATADARAGRSPGFRRAYRTVLSEMRRVATAVIRPVVVVAVLALSVAGIPWAIAWSVRWLFVAQAAVVDGAAPRRAAALSANAVAGRWWRTAAIGLFLGLVGILPGPLLGILLLVFASRSVAFVNGLSSLFYAVLLPLSVIGFTQLYHDRGEGGAEAMRGR